MKTKAIFTWALITLMLVAWGAVPMGFAQDENDFAWLDEITKPGPELKRLDALVGSWKAKIKLYDGENDKNPAVIDGTTERKWVVGGRYLQEISENPTDKGVFIGTGYWGFNRVTAMYEFLWMSTEAVGMSLEYGRFDPTANVLRTSGGSVEPASGFYIQSRSELKIESPDSHTMVVYETEEDGREYKSVEITWTKK